MSIKPDKGPGHYLTPIDIKLDGESIVDTVALSTNSPPPANSKYIAYDELTPPNPFLAVTQDGKGNVVYDGGFPKFYNTRNSAYGVGTPFADLPGQLKFLWNAINFISNKAKVAAGNRKVLLIGDKTTGSYWVKSTTGNGFKTTFTNVIVTMGYDLTIKDASDYGGTIDISLTELDQYCCAIFMSSDYISVPRITDAAVNNFLTYRQNGSGLFFITDHGNVINDLDTAVNGSYSGFFRTANKIIVNFGAWFSGTYNRTSVNVGYLRENYGDHPMYAGMTDADNISAGGSESEVVLASNDTYSADQIPNVSLTSNGDNTVNILSVTTDGEVVTERFLYTIGDTPLASVVTQDGVVPFNGAIETYKKFADFRFISNYPSLGTLVGEIYIDDEYLGTVTIDGDDSSYQWITAPNTPVISGTRLTLQVIQPYKYLLNWIIDRKSLDFTDGRSVSNLFKTDFIKHRGLGMMRNVNKHLVESVSPFWRPDSASLMNAMEGYEDGNLDYDSIEVYLVTDFQNIFENRLFSTTEKTVVVNRDTREVYLPTEQGWVLSNKSAGELLGVGRVLVDKFNGSTYTTTSEPRDDVNYPLHTPLYDDQKLYGYCSVLQTPLSIYWVPTEVPNAKWIWDRKDAGSSAPAYEDVHLRKWFYSPYTGKASLTALCDNGVDGVWVNGVSYFSGDISHRDSNVKEIDVRAGMNLIHAKCYNVGGPAAFLAYIIDKDGGLMTKTDGSWLKYSIPNADTGAIKVTNQDDVTIPYDRRMILKPDDKIEYSIDFKSPGPTGGVILGLHHVRGADGTERNHRGLDIWTEPGSSSLSVHFTYTWDELPTTKGIKIITSTTHPDFVDIWDGNWHTIEVRYDGSRNESGLSIYVDGIKQGTLGQRTGQQSLEGAPVLSDVGTPIRIGGRTKISGEPAYQLQSGTYRNLKIKRNDVVIGYYPMHDSYNGRFYDYGIYSVHSNPIVPITTT